MILLLNILLTVFVYAKESVIISPDGPSWTPVSELPSYLPEKSMAYYAGKLISSKRSRCSAWVHPEEYEVYTADHCFEFNHKEGVFTWNGTNYRLDKWECNRGRDICRSIGFKPFIAEQEMPEIILEQDLPSDFTYLIHYQDKRVVISYGTFKPTPISWQVAHYADSYFGSSGGMLVRVIDGRHIAFAVHTSGSRQRKENYSTRIKDAF